jgi:hypothetical protein
MLKPGRPKIPWRKFDVLLRIRIPRRVSSIANPVVLNLLSFQMKKKQKNNNNLARLIDNDKTST